MYQTGRHIALYLARTGFCWSMLTRRLASSHHRRANDMWKAFKDGFIEGLVEATGFVIKVFLGTVTVLIVLTLFGLL